MTVSKPLPQAPASKNNLRFKSDIYFCKCCKSSSHWNDHIFGKSKEDIGKILGRKTQLSSLKILLQFRYLLKHSSQSLWWHFQQSKMQPSSNLGNLRLMTEMQWVGFGLGLGILYQIKVFDGASMMCWYCCNICLSRIDERSFTFLWHQF